MLTVAYITNEFPSPVEPYVIHEIEELRKRGVRVLACSARRPNHGSEESGLFPGGILYLQPLQWKMIFQTIGLCLRNPAILAKLIREIAAQPNEPPTRRIRALAHTLLGAYFAHLLKNREVEHIHVHHGYFSSWIAMTAARLLGITFSMTLHGSDLLLHHAYLGLKLKHCKFCLTISEFNRQHILSNYAVDAGKVLVQRMGVEVLAPSSAGKNKNTDPWFIMLAVGRLHPVKDHAFLLRACQQLKNRGVRFICLIAGEGPERAALEKLIQDLGLQDHVTLLGHLSRTALENYYSICDLVVLTSRSEGVPLVLMEAMAHGRLVLAPAITGIPELVMDGKTGFLYSTGSLEDFVSKAETISKSQPTLDGIRRSARRHVLEHFNRARNLAVFADLFPTLVGQTTRSDAHANPLLQ